jgi:undecaprenyl-diphosphatase
MLAAAAVGLGPPWFAILLVIWAPMVGMARVAMGVHYLSDVIVGALLGIFMGFVNYTFVPGWIIYFSTT